MAGWNDSTSMIGLVSNSKNNIHQLAVGPTVVSGLPSQPIYYATNITSAAKWGTSVLQSVKLTNECWRSDPGDKPPMPLGTSATSRLPDLPDPLARVSRAHRQEDGGRNQTAGYVDAAGRLLSHRIPKVLSATSTNAYTRHYVSPATILSLTSIGRR